MGSPAARGLVMVGVFMLLAQAVPWAAAQTSSTYNGMWVTLTPDSLVASQTNSVQVKLETFGGSPVSGKKVSLCGRVLDTGFPTTPPSNLSEYGGSCPHFESTRSNGVATISARPFTTGTVYVYVDDQYASRSVTVHAGALQVSVSPSSPTSSDPVTVTVALPDGSTPSGSLVRLFRNGVYQYESGTDFSGRVSYGALTTGTYEARASRSSYVNATATFLVREPSRADLQMTSTYVPSSANVGEPVEASVGISNLGNAAGSAELVLFVNGVQSTGRTVTLGASESTMETLTFVAATPGTYTVQARLGATRGAPWTLSVTQPARFTLQSSSIPANAEVNQPFTVDAFVLNPTSTAGWARVDLNMSGAFVDSREVYVGAGSTQSVSFTVTPRALGTYTVLLSVGTDSMSGTVTVARPEASFSLTTLSAPSQVSPGASYRATVGVSNSARGSGVVEVEILVNGQSRASTSRTLRGGEAVDLVFDLIAPSAPGTYRLEARTALSAVGPTLLTVAAPKPTMPTQVELRSPTGGSIPGLTALLLGASSDGSLVAKGSATVDANGRLALSGTSATHVAIATEDGYAILPIPSSGRLTLPQSVRATAYGAEEQQALAARFEDARVFTVTAAAKRVTVGYAGLDSVDVETSATDARLIVARYGEKPLDPIPAPPGTSYGWFDLHLLRADGTDAPLTRATLRFARPAGAEGTVHLYHYSVARGAWEAVEAVEESPGVFTASVDGFSLFAVGVEAPGLLSRSWLLPVVGIALLAALVGGGVGLTRLRRKRAAAAAAEAETRLRHEHDLHPIVVTPAPPPPPPLVRKAAPRRPLAGDIQLTHVGVRTGGKTFLEDVSFRAPLGTITAIVGPPGSGKAMTLLAILGDAPYIGAIDVGGMSPAEDAADLKRSVGASAAGAQLDRERTVEEIFDAIADKRALPRIDARMRGERVLSLLGSSATGASRVGDLTTPDERRVLIAAALVHEPELLLLDEPTMDLPPAERASLWNGIRRVREDLSLTIIATTQHADDARASDGVVLLDHGRVVAKGAPAAVADRLGEGPAP